VTSLVLSGVTTITRPAGGKIVGLVCSDGIVHVFAWHEAPPRIEETPACRSEVRPLRAAGDEDDACERCCVGALAWAQGGELWLPGGAS
jgi:hypothetical protein